VNCFPRLSLSSFPLTPSMSGSYISLYYQNHLRLQNGVFIRLLHFFLHLSLTLFCFLGPSCLLPSLPFLVILSFSLFSLLLLNMSAGKQRLGVGILAPPWRRLGTWGTKILALLIPTVYGFSSPSLASLLTASLGLFALPFLEMGFHPCFICDSFVAYFFFFFFFFFLSFIMKSVVSSVVLGFEISSSHMGEWNLRLLLNFMKNFMNRFTPPPFPSLLSTPTLYILASNRHLLTPTAIA